MCVIISMVRVHNIIANYFDSVHVRLIELRKSVVHLNTFCNDVNEKCTNTAIKTLQSNCKLCAREIKIGKNENETSCMFVCV